MPFNFIEARHLNAGWREIVGGYAGIGGGLERKKTVFFSYFNSEIEKFERMLPFWVRCYALGNQSVVMKIC